MQQLEGGLIFEAESAVWSRQSCRLSGWAQAEGWCKDSAITHTFRPLKPKGIPTFSKGGSEA
ncbi:hypothetical protein LBMAG57_24210 [Verrucomicrobiota bacterium]|nr:hypothetical protein LBMAG57_24210 [Verrucomicrobiota bacterium]